MIESHTVEGEIGLVIDYEPGRSHAVDVLQGAMDMIHALDRLDAALLSSVDTSLEPVSVLNDIQHSSLKMLLARALRHMPDELAGNLDWKKWVGGLLVRGKYKLLAKIEADAPEIKSTLAELDAEYDAAPARLLGYKPPQVSDVIDALDSVAKARAQLPGQTVTVQTELGDIAIPETAPASAPEIPPATQTITNGGTEFFKVKFPDLLGSAQWTVLRNNRNVKIDMLHQAWLDAYHRREHALLPGDSIKCHFEEKVAYDAAGNEIERRLAIIEVLEIISPPVQNPLL